MVPITLSLVWIEVETGSGLVMPVVLVGESPFSLFLRSCASIASTLRLDAWPQNVS